MATAHVHRLGARMQAHLVGRHFIAAAEYRAFHQAIVDVDHLFKGNDTFVASAKHIAIYEATLDEDTRTAAHHTGGFAQVAVFIPIDASATTINVAFELVAAFKANRAIVNSHFGVFVNVAVLTATKHRAFDIGTSSYGNLCVFQVGQVYKFLTNHTFCTAIDVAAMR